MYQLSDDSCKATISTRVEKIILREFAILGQRSEQNLSLRGGQSFLLELSELPPWSRNRKDLGNYWHS